MLALLLSALLSCASVTHSWAAWYRTEGQEPQRRLVFPVDMAAANAVRHMLHAPLWMTGVQPSGTPARLAQWDGKPRAPLSATLSALVDELPVSSGTADFARVLEWFAPRYQAWKADPSKAITEAEVLGVFPTFFSSSSAASV